MRLVALGLRPYPGGAGVTMTRSTTDRCRSEEARLGRATAGRAARTAAAAADRRRTPGPAERAGAAPARRSSSTSRCGPDVVREPILASWTRSRLWHVPADHIELPFETDLDAGHALLARRPPGAARGRRAVRHRAGERDPLRRRRRRAHRRHRRLRASRRTWTGSGWPPGSATPSEHVGTNGIGTALEGGGPAQVFGHEHYVEHLEDLACAGRADPAPGHAARCSASSTSPAGAATPAR